MSSEGIPCFGSRNPYFAKIALWRSKKNFPHIFISLSLQNRNNYRRLINSSLPSRHPKTEHFDTLIVASQLYKEMGTGLQSRLAGSRGLPSLSYHIHCWNTNLQGFELRLENGNSLGNQNIVCISLETVMKNHKYKL